MIKNSLPVSFWRTWYSCTNWSVDPTLPVVNTGTRWYNVSRSWPYLRCPDVNLAHKWTNQRADGLNWNQRHFRVRIVTSVCDSSYIPRCKITKRGPRIFSVTFLCIHPFQMKQILEHLQLWVAPNPAGHSKFSSKNINFWRISHIFRFEPNSLVGESTVKCHLLRVTSSSLHVCHTND